MEKGSLSDENIAKCLSSHDLRVTPQRISIYRYLCKNRIHPSADTVYKNIVKRHPSFSRTTVYNSLNALVKSGLVIEVRLDDKEQRYDSNTSFHGHFRCDVCSVIYDFAPHEFGYDGLENFEIRNKDVYFTGVCPACQKRLEKN